MALKKACIPSISHSGWDGWGLGFIIRAREHATPHTDSVHEGPRWWDEQEPQLTAHTETLTPSRCFPDPRCTAGHTHNPVSTSDTEEKEGQCYYSVSCGCDRRKSRSKNTHRKMGYPVKDLGTTDHIPLDHFQLDNQGIPLFSILRIQLWKQKRPWRPKRFKIKLLKLLQELGLWPNQAPCSKAVIKSKGQCQRVFRKDMAVFTTDEALKTPSYRPTPLLWKWTLTPEKDIKFFF